MRRCGGSLWVGIVLGIAAILALPGPGRAADAITVGQAFSVTWEFLPAQIALERGLWKKRDLEVKLLIFRGSGALQQAFAAGSLDLGLAAGTDLTMVAKGVPVKMVASIAPRPTNMILLAGKESGIKTPQDLKGKRIGITTHGSLTDWLVKTVARMQGWDPDRDITRVPLGGAPNLIAGLKTKQVDAIFSTYDFGGELVAQGEGTVLLSFGDYIRDFEFEIIVATERMIREKPDAVRRFLQGWFEAVEVMKKDKDYALGLAVEKMKVRREVAERSYAHNMDNMSSTGIINEKGLRVIAESLKDLGITEAVPDYRTFFTTQFLPVTY